MAREQNDNPSPRYLVQSRVKDKWINEGRFEWCGDAIIEASAIAARTHRQTRVIDTTEAKFKARYTSNGVRVD